MRTSVVFTILVMGSLAVLLAIVTGNIYRDLALENQRKALIKLVELEVNDQLTETLEQTNRLSLSVQANKNFREALATNRPDILKRELEDQFYRHYVVTGEIDIEKFILFDDNFEPVVQAASESSQLDEELFHCSALIERLKGMSSVERLHPLSDHCLEDGRLYLSSVVPVGGVRLNGYLQTIVDPLLNIKTVEHLFGMPLVINYANGREAFRSSHWPAVIDRNKTAVVEYVLQDSAAKPYLSVRFAFDVAGLYTKLTQTKSFVMLGAGLITLLTIWLALLGLQKATLVPLERLTKQLELLRESNEYLGQKVEVGGNKEVSQLAKGFNTFTSELHEAYQALEKMAFTDALTGLPNRELFYDRLNQLLLMSRRESSAFSLFVMDLDRFKYINDTLGHHVGDKLLVRVAERIGSLVRETDTIARMGGDEFAVLLPKVIDVQGAMVVAERIQATLTEPLIIEGNSLRVGVSIGIVMFPYHADSQNDLIKRADVAMYYAKHNQLGYAFYEAEIDTHNVLELTLETELKHAIQNDGLRLYFQPKINLETGEVYGVEALVRWIHLERGFIPPDSFIPMAEETGLIHPLTVWVLKEAVAQVREWHDQGIALNMAVNLSAQSLRDPSLVETIEEILREAALEPQHLTLELTETAVMSDPEQALKILTALDELGVMLSIDDFGTGYSSLAYLKKLPVDEIKIDRSFVMEMDVDKNDKVIVQSTIDLAHNMGLKVIAEGIETNQSWNTLKLLGCDMGQGYFMCRPVDAKTLLEWLEDSDWVTPGSDTTDSGLAAVQAPVGNRLT